MMSHLLEHRRDMNWLVVVVNGEVTNHPIKLDTAAGEEFHQRAYNQAGARTEEIKQAIVRSYFTDKRGLPQI